MYRIIGADQKEYGPVSADQLRRWVADGRANGDSLIQAEGSTDWKPLSSFPELASAAAAPPLRPTATTTPDVPNYLIPAILSLCCCLPSPFGIVAIIYAAQVNGKLVAGDYEAAGIASQKAKMWCWIAFGLGVVVNVIGSIFLMEFLSVALQSSH